MEYAVTFLCCAVGCAVNTVCGFGFGITCMMFVPGTIGSAVHAAAMVNLLTCLQAGWLAVRYRQHIRWKMMLVPAAAYLLFSTLAVHLSAGLDNRVMERILGAFLLLLSAYFIFAARRVHIRASTWAGLTVGGISGVMSGMFATGGPPASLYFSAATATKEEYLATIQCFFALTNVYVVALRALQGELTAGVLTHSAIGLAGLGLGLLLGEYIFRRISADLMRKAIYAMMGISGLVMLLR